MAKKPKGAEIDVRRYVDVALYLLRHRIKESEYRHVDIQAQLGWGKSYVSQLINKKKALRIYHVIYILEFLGESPAEFWEEVFSAEAYRRMQADKSERLRKLKHENPARRMSRQTRELLDEIIDLRRVTRALCGILLQKNVFTLQDLENACRNQQSD